MRKEVSILMILLLGGVILSSGCLSKMGDVASTLLGTGECQELEEELASQGLDCNCYPSDFVPKEFANKTGAEGRCVCSCEKNTTVNKSMVKVSVIENSDGETIVSRLTS